MYTKEQLEKLSDLDLNIKIAYMIYRDLGGRDYTQYLARYHSPEQGCDVIAYCGSELDYCNNWSDIMPLAFANKINFNYYEDDNGGYYSCTSGEDGYESHENECDHEKPGRAAAIVYLLMQGDK